MLSLVVPVYKNELNINDLVGALDDLSLRLSQPLEVVFVVDGSPDRSHQLLLECLPGAKFRSQLLLLSRNFGSFAAIRAGLSVAQGDFFAVMAADLQEPPELILEFERCLASNEVDVALGERLGREDTFTSRVFSNIFWALYRRIVQSDMPPGGVDIFACNKVFRDALIALEERNSTLVGLIIWLGFRRKHVPYHRRRRLKGKSAWTFKKKVRYLHDSVYAFSDLPLRLLIGIGITGMCIAVGFSAFVVVAKLLGFIQVPGYAATILVVTFFGGLNSFGIGVLGGYLWRTFENTKARPNYTILSKLEYSGLNTAGNSAG